MDEQVQVQTNDGQLFTVLYSHVRDCEVIRGAVETCGFSIAVPLPQVASTEFKRIIEWRKHCVENPTLEAKDSEEVSPLKKKYEPTEWQNAYVADLSNHELNNLLMAANYINDRSLLHFLMNFIAYTKILGKTPDEIRQYFEVDAPLTDEEMQAVLEDAENAFMKEDP